MSTSRADEPPSTVFARWAWRLLPVFAAVAIFTVWDAWRSSPDRELEIRSGIENRSVQWAFIRGITGKPL